MKHFGLYTCFTWLDARKVGVLTHIIILTGICLPILVLLGLKNGHIANIQEQISTSTSGRRILVRKTGNDGKFKNGFEESNIPELYAQYPNIDVIVPAFSLTMELKSIDGVRHAPAVSFHPSCKGDPYLSAKSRNADVFDDTDKTLKSVVISSSVAEKLNVKPGDNVIGKFRRSTDSDENVEITLKVEKVIDIILDDTKEASDEGYASKELMLALLSYRKGNEVKQFPQLIQKEGKTVTQYAIDWPAKNSQPIDTYSGCFVFVPKNNPLNDVQKNALLESKKKYEMIPVTNSEIATLYGVLKPDLLEKVDVYFKRLINPQCPVTTDPNDTSWFTKQTAHGGMFPKYEKTINDYSHKLASVDGSIIYWNQRLRATVNGKPVWLVGVTMTVEDRWLLKYTQKKDSIYCYEDSFDDVGIAYTVKAPAKWNNQEYISVDINEKCKLKLQNVTFVNSSTDNNNTESQNANNAEQPIPALTDDAKPAEEQTPAPTEEVKPAEEQTPTQTDEVKPVEEATPVPTDEAKPAEEANPAPADEAKPAEEANPTPAEEVKPAAEANPTPAHEAKPVEEATPTPTEEVKPVEEATPAPADEAKPAEPAPVEEVKPAEPAPSQPTQKETPAEDSKMDTIPSQTTSTQEASSPVDGNTVSTASPSDESEQQTQTENQEAKAEPSATEEEILIVPAQLLSQIYDYLNGNATYATSINRFVENPTTPHFSGLNIYAQNIRQVPQLEDDIHADYHLFVESARDQINEMVGLESLLNDLVYFFALIMLAFGIFTVIVIIKDSTERKRKEIGIMRVMGVSRGGIFYYVLLRSLIIAAGALCLTLVGAYAIKYGLMLLYSNQSDMISLVYSPKDVLIVSLGAITCCFVGTLFPAWVASRIDPFEAVTREA